MLHLKKQILVEIILSTGDEMNQIKPKIGLASNKNVKENYLTKDNLNRINKKFDFRWGQFDEESSWDEPPNTNQKVKKKFANFCKDLDGLIVCHGSPLVDEEVLKVAKNLKFIGELEGDRFSQRIDLEASFKKNINVVDTTHGSSYPVAEWALALSIVGLKNGGYHFRKMINGEISFPDNDRTNDPGFIMGELWERKVGLIGCGHIGRRLLSFLKPFNTENYVYDPYLNRDIADIYQFTQTSLEYIMSNMEVIICLAPLTPKTEGMIGEKELNLIQPGSILVNVSRGAIIKTDALIKRLNKKDIIASLDVFDPEPVPVDSPIRKMENVFLSPHVAGVTKKCQPRFFSIMIEELERFFSGHKTKYNLSDFTISNRKGL
ncbi:MAG: hypothetical protein CL907_01795 [Dehalococcoidia bacterium]|nr:hypothetical protein [Dehalococcoidia bacterium]|tara:strand:- start:2795 stop:3925 length:1131 start_codon:yes stop_codon:yes gene_type:complete